MSSLVPIDAALTQYKPDDYSVRLVHAVFKVIPYAPELKPYIVIEDAVRALEPNMTAVHIAKARQQSMNQDILDVLWMAGLVDSADKMGSVYSGLSSIFGLIRGHGTDALETDGVQKADAVLKGLAVAYMAYNAFPGSIAERVEAFRSTPAGQALAMYYAAVEIALPFADNAATVSGNFFQGLMDKEGSAQASRLAGLAGGKSLDGAMQMVSAITQPIQRVIDHTAQYTKPIAQSAAAYAPGAANAADKVAGAVATAADLLPVYGYLGARLAAEGAAWRAIKG